MIIRAAVVIAVLVFVGCASGGASFEEKEWRARVEAEDPATLTSPHFADGEYFNPWMEMEDRGFFQFLVWRLFGKKAPYTDEERGYLPAVIPGAPERIASLNGSDFILWVGHATFLMRLNGEYWITDPVFSDRIILPVRVTPPALSLADLANLGAPLNVVISHNHYDHLDMPSIKALPQGTRFFVPRGIGAIIRDAGWSEVAELDWWEETKSAGGAAVTCIPAQHWSRRILEGRNKALWGSFLIRAGHRTVYFAGDSGYYIGFREIGRRFPGIDYALMPTTAYNPRWFMHYAHMDVRESLDAFTDLGARYFIPTQWGTFHLGEEPPGYPALDLRREIVKRGLDPARFLIMDIGGIAEIAGQP